MKPSPLDLSTAAVQPNRPDGGLIPISGTLKTLAIPAGWRRALMLIAIGLAGVGVVAVIDLLHGFHAHAPRLSLFARMAPVIQLHVAAAVLALGIGTALLVGVKGRTFHKLAGWTWVACMMTVAISSFWIRDHGHFSPIHFLSGWTSIAVPMAIAAVRRKDIKRHRSMMTGVFMGGLILAGVFTFVPGRLMWHVFVG